MSGSDDPASPEKRGSGTAPTNNMRGAPASNPRSRAQLLSLREQLDSVRILYERLYAASTRLIQAIGQADVIEALGETIEKLIGAKEVAIFLYDEAAERFQVAWSNGVADDTLRRIAAQKSLVEHSARHRAARLSNRQVETLLLHGEKNVTACSVLRTTSEVVGVIVIFSLLPQKNGLEWADHELLRMLETYGAVAIQLQAARKDSGKP